MKQDIPTQFWLQNFLIEVHMQSPKKREEDNIKMGFSVMDYADGVPGGGSTGSVNRILFNWLGG